MSLPTYARATVIILRAPTKLVHGSEVFDWTPAGLQRITFTNCCLVQAAATSEDLDHREAMRGTYDVWLPEYDDDGEPTAVRGTDKAVLPNGREYRISGDPEEIQSPSGALDGWQLLCERWADR